MLRLYKACIDLINMHSNFLMSKPDYADLTDITLQRRLGCNFVENFPAKMTV